MTINQRIKYLRKSLNMSQAKFAKALAISNGYIAGIELEHNNVNERIIMLICLKFNVRELWLKTGEGDIFEEKLDQRTEIAVNSFKKLKPKYQNFVLNQIDQLIFIQNTEDDS